MADRARQGFSHRHSRGQSAAENGAAPPEGLVLEPQGPSQLLRGEVATLRVTRGGVGWGGAHTLPPNTRVILSAAHVQESGGSGWMGQLLMRSQDAMNLQARSLP